MGWWQVNADTLAGSRFVISALAEATASLMALEKGVAAHPGERAWLDAHQPPYRERLAGDQITALLMRAALGRNWIADFLTPTPAGEGEQAFGGSQWGAGYCPAPHSVVWPSIVAFGATPGSRDRPLRLLAL